MLELIKSMFRPKSGTPRRTENECLALARDAARTAGHDVALLHMVRFVDGESPRWIVSEASIGSCLVVEIDDATGEVISMDRLSGR